jgi:hypothetical protein
MGEIPFDAKWNAAATTYGQVPEVTRQDFLQTGGVWNPNGSPTTGLVSRSYQGKSRTGLTTPPFVDGWRYASAYTVDLWRTDYAEPDEYWTANGGLRSRWRARPTVDPLDAQNFTVAFYANQLSSLRSRAETEALARFSSVNLQLGVTLLEAHKTIGHLAHTAIRVLQLYRDLRHGNFGRVAEDLGLSLSSKSVRSLAKNWLEYKYAWMPLLQDVQGAFNIAKEGIAPPLTVKAVRSVRDSAKATYRRMSLYSISSSQQSTQYVYDDVEPTLGVKVTLHAKVKIPNLAALSALGLVNPLSIAWELVPFSFVVDWILPVGTFLEACTAPLGLEFVDGSLVRVVSLDHSYQACANRSGSLTALDKGGVSCHTRLFRMSRSKYSSFPIPVLFRKPFLSTDHAVTALALLHTTRRQTRSLRL